MNNRSMMVAFLIVCLIGLAVAIEKSIHDRMTTRHFEPIQIGSRQAAVPDTKLSTFQKAILKDCDRQAEANIKYHDGYYQGGDPPPNLGVCTDVVIRSFKAAGIDLQKEVARSINNQPNLYKINKPDKNIDHRRCRNLAIYFKQYAVSLPIDQKADWQPGDIIFWDTSQKGIPGHVGIIANTKDEHNLFTVYHHWPGLPVSNTTSLFEWKVLFHFRYKPIMSKISGFPGDLARININLNLYT